MEQEKVWDAIAEKWAKFRVEPVGEVVEFLDNKKGARNSVPSKLGTKVPSSSGRVLDLGCG